MIKIIFRMKTKLLCLCKRYIYLMSLVILFISCSNQKEHKVLIIGIDGCRPDALIKATTNNIDSLLGNSAFSFNAKTDVISSSGICWTGMLTGVWHIKHNILTNNYRDPHIDEFPHFFRRVKQFDPELKTYSIVNWSPIHKILQDGDADVVKSFNTDEEVTDEVIRNLKENDVDVMFVQLDEVDHTGHEYDFSPESKGYIQYIQIADDQVGRMVQSLKQRVNYRNENWLIIITTDHGGSNFTHGQNIKEHTTIFYIVTGDDVAEGEITDDVNVIDVCITAMQHLGITVKEEWNLDGKVSGLRN